MFANQNVAPPSGGVKGSSLPASHSLFTITSADRRLRVPAAGPASSCSLECLTATRLLHTVGLPLAQTGSADEDEEDMMSRVSRCAFAVLCCLSLALFSACATSTITLVPTTAPTQRPAVATPTTAPGAAFRQELGALTDLRGHFVGGSGGESEPLAGVTLVHVFVQLVAPSLANAQWDAFAIQQALWTGQVFTIPAGWEVSVQIFVPSTEPNTSSLGREIGVANLHAASARQFAWDHLSPQQAWAQYDGAEYSPTGL